MSGIVVVPNRCIGLTTSGYLAHVRHEVASAEVFPDKVERLNLAQILILDAQFHEIVEEGLGERCLSFEVAFRCLPTAVRWKPGVALQRRFEPTNPPLQGERS